jgi:hypothetical protein
LLREAFTGVWMPRGQVFLVTRNGGRLGRAEIDVLLPRADANRRGRENVSDLCCVKGSAAYDAQVLELFFDFLEGALFLRAGRLVETAA